MKATYWSGLSYNKKTGKEIDFFIWKDGQTMTFTPDEARTSFPELMVKHERGLNLFNIFGR